jgi:hypothetical protein
MLMPYERPALRSSPYERPVLRPVGPTAEPTVARSSMSSDPDQNDLARRLFGTTTKLLVLGDAAVPVLRGM